MDEDPAPSDRNTSFLWLLANDDRGPWNVDVIQLLLFTYTNTSPFTSVPHPEDRFWSLLREPDTRRAAEQFLNALLESDASNIDVLQMRAFLNEMVHEIPSLFPDRISPTPGASNQDGIARPREGAVDPSPSAPNSPDSVADDEVSRGGVISDREAMEAIDAIINGTGSAANYSRRNSINEHLRPESPMTASESDVPSEVSDDSASEIESPPLAASEYEEDASVPNEEELKEIEGQEEKRANDHAFFEKTFFKPLDDPEYIPADVGRIEWTAEGVRGTWQNPNQERILRSPRVRIGDLDWNIKYYPRGNGTMSHLSVYLECSKPTATRKRTRKTRDTAAGKKADTIKNVSTQTSSSAGPEIATDDNDSNTRSSIDRDAEKDALMTDKYGHDEEDSEVEDEVMTDVTTESDVTETDGPKELDWGTAAQFGVVIYNPDEPRTFFFHGNHHLFCGSAPDWGWTRFHGPYNTIHKRQPLQRKPLLCNDRLSFTAYIRIIKDETKFLWDHSFKSGDWDSFAKTGRRGLSGAGLNMSYKTAGLASWLGLWPVKEVICSITPPDPRDPTIQKPMPVVFQLQSYIHRLQTGEPHPPRREISMILLVNALEANGVKFNDSMDVVEFWEVLRTRVEQELQGTSSENGLRDIFDLELTYPANWPDSKLVLGGHSVDKTKPAHINGLRLTADENCCLQYLIRRELTKDGSAIHPKFNKVPPILHIELDRKALNKKKNCWYRRDSMIELDEKITLKPYVSDDVEIAEYTLYGFITHKGDIDSGRYDAIIRPGGSQTRWFQYISEFNVGRVVTLTQRQMSKLNSGLPEASAYYVAIYLRDDFIKRTLQASFDTPQPPQSVRDYVDHHFALRERWVPERGRREVAKHNDEFNNTQPSSLVEGIWGKPITVTVYLSDIFILKDGAGYVGFGDLLDNTATQTYVFQLDTEDKRLIEHIEEMLVERLPRVNNTEQIQIWKMENGRPSETLKPDHALSNPSSPSVKIELWARILKQSANAALPNVPIAPVSPVDNAASSEEMFSMDVDEPNGNGPESNIDNTSNQPAQISSDGEANSLSEGPSPTEASSQGESTQLTFASLHPAAESVSTYVLFKFFDAVSQTLKGVGSSVVPRDEFIETYLLRQSHIPSNATLSIWLELKGYQALAVDGRQRFKDAHIHHGQIIIYQLSDPEDVKDNLRARALPLDAGSYLKYLASIANFPKRINGFYSSSYFSGPSFKGELVNTMRHGHGVYIDEIGQTYNGSFESDQFHGKGTMTYKNGDVYDGDWVRDQKFGQGKMVYRDTGNTYEGGWKHNSRSGKGVLKIETAEWDASYCDICYEAEKDCVFNDCGHICACYNCAKLLRDCPVCRKRIISVIKTYKS